MKTGTFTYLGHDGRRRYLRVQECPNPFRTRVLLQEITGTQVRWQEARP